MAQDIIAKSASNLNYNSRRHLRLYQKVLFTGSQMAYLLNRYDREIGLPKIAGDCTAEWSHLMERLAEVLL